MKLKEYVEQYMVKNKQLADRLKIDPSTLCKIIFGRMQPKLSTAILIEKITEGKVTVYDWEEPCNINKAIMNVKVKMNTRIKRTKKT